jgi:riboflavin biosynthesis pyrimidine reductase
VVVLTETVSDADLAGLREDGVSYIFAGAGKLDLKHALEILNRELGIRRLEANGGGVTNGAFLHAGLIDEISVAIFPAVDGAKGAPCVFEAGEDAAGTPAPLRSMTLAAARCWNAARSGSAIRFETANLGGLRAGDTDEYAGNGKRGCGKRR